jgi:hypothetical protein
MIEGKTYPQEGPMDLEAFRTYFFTSASTTIIGILHANDIGAAPATLEEARSGRDWEECVGGCFYMYV